MAERLTLTCGSQCAGADARRDRALRRCLSTRPGRGRIRRSCSARRTISRTAGRHSSSARRGAATRSSSRTCAGGSSPRGGSRLRQRAAGWLRHAGVARRAAVVQRRRRHVRRVVRRADAVAGGDQRPPGAEGDCPERHRRRLPRGLDLSGRRVRTRLQPLVDDGARWPSIPSLRKRKDDPAAEADFQALLDRRGQPDGGVRAPAARRARDPRASSRPTTTIGWITRRTTTSGRASMSRRGTTR